MNNDIPKLGSHIYMQGHLLADALPKILGKTSQGRDGYNPVHVQYPTGCEGKMKNFKVRQVLYVAFIGMVMAAAVSVSANAQDSSFGKRYQKNESDWNDKGEPIGCQRELPLDPVFDNVKRVLILVDVSPNYDAGDKEQASFPQPMRKASLESLLKEIYTERYRKIDGMNIPNCYNREGQDILVINFHDPKQREKINALIKKTGTLVAYFSINTSHAKNIRSSHSAISLIHWRSDMPVFDQYRYIGKPLAIEIDGDNTEMVNKLRGYVRNQIRY